MGFFDTLRRVLGAEPDLHRRGDAAGRARGWNAPDDGPAGDAALGHGVYDRLQWQKKMKRILDELPASESEWAGLMSDAQALEFESDWVAQSQVEEFLLLIRRAVADRHFTEDEHRKLDLARRLIGIPEAEAEATLRTVVAEAEQFFGKPVEEE